MPTVEELFARNVETEEHIVIGTDRYITVPKPLQRIAVQFDHDVETVTFDCPRYWDDIDMSTMTVYINCKLPNGDLDAYPAKNIKVDGDIMHFDWTISRNLTQYKGQLTFLVCAKKTDTGGVEVNHWNSELCTDMYISEGMECDPQAQMEYTDLITQLLERMTVVEQINVNAEEMREMHDEVLNETTGARQIYANAFKGTISGEVVLIDDVSPVKHNVKTKVYGNIDPTTVTVTGCGKNIIKFPYKMTSRTINDVTFTVNADGTVHIKGTATAQAAFQLMNIDLGDKSIVAVNGIASGNGYTLSKRLVYNCDTKFIYIVINKNVSVDEVVYPQVEHGNQATEYESYRGGTYTPNPDGTCDVVSVSPTMTLLTDTAGVIIDCTYNRDSTAVLGDISSALNELHIYAQGVIAGGVVE